MYQESRNAPKAKKYPYLIISNHPRWRMHVQGDDITWLREIATCKVMGPDGALAALKEARARGQIDYIGITGHDPHVLTDAIRTQEFDTVLVPLNVLDRRATETLIPLAN
jgi:aryl-alcohol dehydrogenase-like predicted oxidoreductase